MQCNQCRSEVPDDSRFCPGCGAELSSPVVTEQTTRCPRRWFRGILAVLAFLVLVLAGAAVGLYYARYSPVEMTALVPGDSEVVVAADGPWLWRASSDLRTSQVGRGVWQTCEKTLGISIEKDLMPWVGEFGISSLGANRNGEVRLAIYAQVRDSRQFAACVGRFTENAGKRGPVQWTEGRYRGVTLYRGRYDGGGVPPVEVAVAYVRGWCVAGIGSHTIEQVIDAAQGMRPTLAGRDDWTAALALLPKRRSLWIGVDGQAAAGVARRINPAAGAVNESQIPPILYVAALTEGARQLRLDVATVPQKDDLKAQLMELGAQLKPVDEQVLARLPDGAFAAVLCSNPNLYWGFAKAKMLSAAQHGQSDYGYADRFKVADEVLGYCTGTTAVAFAWRKDRGMGIAATTETDSDRRVAQAVERLRTLSKGLGAPIQERNGTYGFPGTHSSTVVCDSVYWRSQGKWIDVGSWIDPGAGSDLLRMPEEANGAGWVAVGNLRFLPALLDRLSEGEGLSSFGANRENIEAVRSLGLETTEWAGWSRISPEDGSARASFVLKMDWRKVVKRLVAESEPSHDGGLWGLTSGGGE